MIQINKKMHYYFILLFTVNFRYNGPPVISSCYIFPISIIKFVFIFSLGERYSQSWLYYLLLIITLPTYYYTILQYSKTSL